MFGKDNCIFRQYKHVLDKLWETVVTFAYKSSLQHTYIKNLIQYEYDYYFQHSFNDNQIH